MCWQVDTRSLLSLFLTCPHLRFNALPQASMYGKRSGCLPGLIIMSKDKLNIMKESKAWKQQVVSQVEMLSRANMFKPEVTYCWDRLACL